MDQVWWSTVEHYFQAQKFTDPAYREKVRLTATAKQAAALGRSRAVPLRPDWEEVKVDIMRTAVLKKFRTHPGLRVLLLETEQRPIVENAPGDYFWGCGQDGSGQNWLGQILEQIRKEIASEIVS